ncbi:MAG: ABC transporter ATP-binding protein, partial [Chloroflexota bacterium]
MKTKIPSARQVMWRFMLVTPGLSLLVFVTYSLYLAFPLAFGLVMREFFNALTGEAETSFTVWTLIGLYFGTRILVQLSEIVGAGSSALHYYVIEGLMRRNTFRTMLTSAGFSTPHSSGEIVERLDEDTEGAAEANFLVTYGITVPLMALLPIGVMLSINIPLTIVSFIPLLISFFVLRALGDRIQTYREAARESSGQVSGLLSQLLNGVQAVKVASAEAAVLSRFKMLNNQRGQAVVRDQTFTAFTRSINDTTISLSTGLLLIFAANYMRQGDGANFTVGDFALFISYISLGGSNFGELVHWIGSLVRVFRQSEVSLERLFEIIPSTARSPPCTHASG